MRRYNIAIASILAGIAGQRKLTGIFSAMRAYSDWNVRIFRDQPEIESREFLNGLKADFDGVIYNGYHSPEVFRALDAFAGPLVLMDNDPEMLNRSEQTATISVSAEKIVDAFARYHASVGCFRSVAFIHSRRPIYWSDARCRAVTERFPRARILPPAPNRGETADRKRLVTFLRGLEIPALVLCAFDRRAIETIEAAETAGLRIPDDLSIIGIDNDPFLCESRSVPISSIEPDNLREGEIAARAMNAMLHGGRSAAEDRLAVGVLQTVLRGSTMKPQTSRMLIDRAKDFIRGHACQGITPDTVAAALGVSRPLLDLRLRQAHSPTLASMISDRQLETVAGLLRSTDLPIAAVADQCGFANHNSLRNRFKAKYGVTMHGWRDGAAG